MTLKSLFTWRLERERVERAAIAIFAAMQSVPGNGLQNSQAQAVRMARMLIDQIDSDWEKRS